MANQKNRRTHDDTLFDTKLLTLPTPKQEIRWVEFNSVERAVYDIVKTRFVSRINCMAKAGSKELDKQYSVIWNMLLRLRQLCSHILLIQGTMIDLLERVDFERLREISTEDLSEEIETLLAHLREKMRDSISAKDFEARDGNMAVNETETAPIDQTRSDPSGGNLGGSHGLTYNFGQYLESLRNSEAYEAICERTLCSGCRQPPLDPFVTACFHVYCATCLYELQTSSARRGLDRHRCTECGVTLYYDDAKACQEILEPYISAHENLANSSQDGFGTRSKAIKEKSGMENWTQMRGPILPSAKTIALKARILSWIEEDPDVKIIVFSQFLPMLRILAKVCTTEGWEYEKYTGAVSHDTRENALERFADPHGGIRILLASLKCGGQGLNLTCASRVITLDPWWNSRYVSRQFI
jgi:SNF2 family DNA or RNA helicase